MAGLNNAVGASSQGFQSLNTSTGVWNGRTLTAGTGISITNGDGTGGNPTISSSSTGALAWTDENANFNAVKQNGYFCTAALTATLPASPSEGDTISFVATTTAIVIGANTGQTIQIGNVTSSSAGTATNKAAGDALTLTYRSTGTTWWAYAVQGNWTLA